MHSYSLRELNHCMRLRKFSATELTNHYLERIEKGKLLNAFINVDAEYARSCAAKADKLLAKGNTELLLGIPMAHKDNFCTNILPTTCGSKMLQNFCSPYQATIVRKLAKHGAVILGKTNMDEFAMGSTNENSFFGPVKNPWNLNYVPGGSSGGSAAAVAASMAAFATASDTGGSIRQPAAFCGVSGIKPTYGLVSRYGMVAYASSLDQAGPIAKSVEDLAIILQAMAGFDSGDSTSVNKKIPNYLATLNEPIKGMRIGLPSCFLQATNAEGIQSAILNAAKLLHQEGMEIIELDLSLQHLWVPCYYVIACAEASSNLARYDGIRFGHRSNKGNSLRELIANSRNEGFGREVKRRILIGTHVLSAGYFNDYYLQALKIRRLIQQEMHATLQKVHFLLGPTTPSLATPIGTKSINPSQKYLADLFTVPVNLAGLPAVSIPAGFSDGLPIGLQLIGRPFSEAKLLNVAHHYQKCTNWHQLQPKI